MIRTCRQCGGQFQLDYRGGRPRERCFDCQPAGMRNVSAGAKRQPAYRTPAQPEVLETYQRYLRDFNAEDTIAGAAVLILAAKWAEGGHSTAGIVALMTELRHYMTELDPSANAKRPDELARFRRHRRIVP